MSEDNEKIKNNPFLKSTDNGEKKDTNNRWANLEITDEFPKKNRFLSKNTYRKDQDDRWNHRGPTFMRWTKPKPPTPPPTFDLSNVNLDEDFPALC